MLNKSVCYCIKFLKLWKTARQDKVIKLNYDNKSVILSLKKNFNFLLRILKLRI